MVDFAQNTPVLDATGEEHAGLISYEDIAEWRAAVEAPVSFPFRGLDVHKCSSWTQGPVFLQQLALLDGYDLAGMGLNSADYLHTLMECAKLAFADREAYYGDPLFDQVPFDVLLSPDYNSDRRKLVGPDASMEMRPGDVGEGLPAFATVDVVEDNRRAMGLEGAIREVSPKSGNPGDTTHLDAVDSEGNMVAATPSGGWIKSSPVIKGLGFPLGTRGQMFYLNADRPNAPGTAQTSTGDAHAYDGHTSGQALHGVRARPGEIHRTRRRSNSS